MSEKTFDTSQSAGQMSLNWPRVILTVVLGTGLLAVATYAGYWYGTQQAQQVKKPDTVSERSLLPPPDFESKIFSTPAPTPDIVILANGWVRYRDEGLGFLVEYPQDWKFGKSRIGIVYLADQQEFIDFYVNNMTDMDLPEVGLRGKIYVLEDTVPSNTPEQEALKYEEGRTASPLVSEKYITINGISAHRAARQIKRGDIALGEPYSLPTSTEVQYTYLKGNNLFRMRFEISNDNPAEVIEIIDKVASTFKFLD